MTSSGLEFACPEARTESVGRWELFQHDADIGVRGFGADMSEAFEQVAYALTAVVSSPEAVAATKSLTIECEAPDDELLLYAWLNALVYEMATRGMLFAEFSVSIVGHQLFARIAGEIVNVARHQPAVEVKGATLTELRVEERPDGTWMAQCVVDV